MEISSLSSGNVRAKKKLTDVDIFTRNSFLLTAREHINHCPAQKRRKGNPGRKDSSPHRNLHSPGNWGRGGDWEVWGEKEISGCPHPPLVWGSKELRRTGNYVKWTSSGNRNPKYSIWPRVLKGQFTETLTQCLCHHLEPKADFTLWIGTIISIS